MRRLLIVACALLCLAPSSGWAQTAVAGPNFYPGQITLGLGGSSFITGGLSFGGTPAAPYANLYGDAANTLALRNGTSPQAFNIYKTYTNASNYTRLSIRATAGDFEIQSNYLGTGSATNIILVANNAYVISTQLIPIDNDGRDLGKFDYQWQNIYNSRGLQGSKSKTLIDAAAAASIWSCAVPTSDSIGGELIWTTESTDATDYRVTQGSIRFAGVNKAGTTTCTVGVIGTDLTASSNGNTLVCTWTNVASGTNCLLSATCTDNTAASQTMAVNSRLDMPIPQVCTPQ